MELLNMKPLKKNVSITLDADVEKSIRELADKNSRNFSQYINLVLKRHIESMANTEETDIK